MNTYKTIFLQRSAWTPADDALYKPDDLFRIPLKEAIRDAA